MLLRPIHLHKPARPDRRADGLLYGLFAVLVLGCAAVLFGSVLAALTRQEQRPPTRQDCRMIADPAARLACFDRSPEPVAHDPAKGAFAPPLDGR